MATDTDSRQLPPGLHPQYAGRSPDGRRGRFIGGGALGAPGDPTVGGSGRSEAHPRAARLSAFTRSRSARTEVAALQRRRLADSARALWFKPALAVFGALAAGALLSPIHVH